MTKLPISDFMWNYYQSQGITFSDSERATIIWNSTLPESEILNALREIAARTSDEVLKSQIHERLDAQAEHERCFTEKGSRYFFVFVPDDEDEWESCYFADLDAAIAFGKGHSKETFKILKEPFSDKFHDCDVERDTDAIYMGGQASYTKDGVLIDCKCYSEKISISFSHPYPEYFEDAYIPLQSPFERGDIVRIAGDSRPAIVQVSQADWQRGLQRNTDGSRMLPPTFDNTSITVEFLDNGEMYHGHPCILFLEKLENWYDKLEWNLLQSASGLIRGEGSLDAFLYYYHQNLERKRINHSRNNETYFGSAGKRKPLADLR